MSLIDTALDFARAFLRTPLEKAELNTIPALERWIDMNKAYFSSGQGAIDKATFETLLTLIGASLAAGDVAEAAAVAKAPEEPPAHVGGHPSGTDRGEI